MRKPVRDDEEGYANNTNNLDKNTKPQTDLAKSLQLVKINSEVYTTSCGSFMRSGICCRVMQRPHKVEDYTWRTRHVYIQFKWIWIESHAEDLGFPSLWGYSEKICWKKSNTYAPVCNGSRRAGGFKLKNILLNWGMVIIHTNYHSCLSILFSIFTITKHCDSIPITNWE